MNDEELEKLKDRFGEHGSIEKIERLSRYLESIGKKYASHYATILSWAAKDIETQNSASYDIGEYETQNVGIFEQYDLMQNRKA